MSDVDRAGPPIVFVGKSQGSAKADPDARPRGRGVAVVHVGQGAGLRRRPPPGDRHPPGADRRAALDPLPDRRHPPRRRAVRPAHRRRRDQRLQGARGARHLGEAQAAGRLVRRQARRPRARIPRRDLGLEVGREDGHANPRQRRGRRAGSTTPGCGPSSSQEIRSLVTQPHGMFLCCGPTGSGKTTTLYACLREIDRFQKNIITVEDPIEYHLDNITQMEINTKSGQTFAGSLRSILRQDPDVIMIGEIRDQETATIACQAATTGHMVFSTVHANDTVTALFRLLDLGVEPFMIASALTAVLGQRLVRVALRELQGAVQAQARVPQEGEPAGRQGRRLLPPPDRARSRSARQCGGTGYLGRTGIFELLVITEPMRDMIRENPSINAIKAEARKNGMIYLQEDGLRQVIQGKTSIDELLRVVK